MRKLILLAILNLFFFAIKAQKAPLNVSLSYDVVMFSESNPKLNEKTQLNIFLTATQSRSELVSKLGTEVSLFDNSSGKGAVIKEYSTQKLLIMLSRQNWMSKNKRFQNLKYVDEDGVKTIGTYSCKKSVANFTDGNRLTVYFTKDIILPNNQYLYSLPEINGLPIQYELSSKDGTISYQLKNISFDVISNQLFHIPQSGKYRVMSYEEAHTSREGEK